MPRATVYVHVSAQTLAAGTGVARVEDGLGPATLGQLVDLLGHRHVTLKPVIDLDGQVPVDAYEIPDRLREAVHLAKPASVFPHSNHTGRRRFDLDHLRAHPRGRSHGEQQLAALTSLHNLAPLVRFEHRVKTHAPGWQVTQIRPGVYRWRTRHGYYFDVDAHGTHRLGKQPPQPDDH
jgi:hypothetical protein